MGLFNLFISALMPVLKVVLITLVGSFLAMDRVNILGIDARKHLNNGVFYVFTPALVTSSLGQYITFKSITELWFMPINILITFVVGSVLGWLVIIITRPPRRLRGLVLSSCSAGNLGNLPLILVPAVCKEKGTPFGDVGLCQAHGMSYATLSLAIGSVYFWLYVYNIMRLYSRNDCQEVKPEDSLTAAADEESEGNLSRDRENGGSVESFELELADKEKEKKVDSRLELIREGLRVGRKIDWKSLLAPSTVGAIIGFIIGAVPPFRKALIGDSAPLRVVQDSAYLIGEVAIPAATLIVGANLLKGLKGSAVQFPIVIGIVVARYVVLPIIGVVTVKSAMHFGLLRSDPLYEFVLMFQFAVPPAVSIGTMAQLFEAGESECSVILLSMYALASLTLTFWSMFFMWLIGR